MASKKTGNDDDTTDYDALMANLLAVLTQYNHGQGPSKRGRDDDDEEEVLDQIAALMAKITPSGAATTTAAGDMLTSSSSSPPPLQTAPVGLLERTKSVLALFPRWWSTFTTAATSVMTGTRRRRTELDQSDERTLFNDRNNVAMEKRVSAYTAKNGHRKEEMKTNVVVVLPTTFDPTYEAMKKRQATFHKEEEEEEKELRRKWAEITTNLSAALDSVKDYYTRGLAFLTDLNDTKRRLLASKTHLTTTMSKKPNNLQIKYMWFQLKKLQVAVFFGSSKRIKTLLEAKITINNVEDMLLSMAKVEKLYASLNAFRASVLTTAVDVKNHETSIMERKKAIEEMFSRYRLEKIDPHAINPQLVWTELNDTLKTALERIDTVLADPVVVQYNQEGAKEKQKLEVMLELYRSLVPSIEECDTIVRTFMAFASDRAKSIENTRNMHEALDAALKFESVDHLEAAIRAYDAFFKDNDAAAAAASIDTTNILRYKTAILETHSFFIQVEKIDATFHKCFKELITESNLALLKQIKQHLDDLDGLRLPLDHWSRKWDQLSTEILGERLSQIETRWNNPATKSPSEELNELPALFRALKIKIPRLNGHLMPAVTEVTDLSAAIKTQIDHFNEMLQDDYPQTIVQRFVLERKPDSSLPPHRPQSSTTTTINAMYQGWLDLLQ